MDSLVQSAYSYIFDGQEPLWKVNMEQCVDQIGNNFDKNHFYVKALNLYFKSKLDSHTLYCQLKSYYDKFQPINQKEIFCLDNSYKSKSFYLSSKKYIILPWEVSPRYRVPVEGIPPTEGCQEYGPVSDRKCVLEANRLIKVFKSISIDGFNVQRYGPLYGQVLICSGRSKFLVHNGNHRAAVLSAMNIKKLTYSFRNKYLRIIDDKSCKDWPMVAQGLITMNEAAKFMEDVFFKN